MPRPADVAHSAAFHRDLDIGRFADDTGAVRVVVPVPGWERYVRTAGDGQD
ncbi:hypothetical protein OOK31_19775 [Streptomyces sp. NBC_00249]|uniref:hypothetical protein n=1 Tax=Streptomyces sp. NBC_00249 TaxID=2975690 RepID=UPI0022550AFE|nr:hypothetical protein [Streptomyces sp. NBC_00249]MCX5196107.1 hypothetical protein [Streptomyces sp. NBC_00249]